MQQNAAYFQITRLLVVSINICIISILISIKHTLVTCNSSKGEIILKDMINLSNFWLSSINVTSLPGSIMFILSLYYSKRENGHSNKNDLSLCCVDMHMHEKQYATSSVFK